MNGEPVILQKSYKDHTVENAIDNLDIENLPKSAQNVLLQPIRNLKVTIQILDDESEEVLETITGKANSGDVKADSKSLIRRTGSLDLKVDEDLFPKKDSLIWFNKKIKLYAGLKDMSKSNEYVNFLLGTFWIDTVNYSVDVNSRSIDLSLSDKMGQYQDTELEKDMKIDIGTPISIAMQKLMEHLGEKKFGFIQESNPEEVVPYTLEFKIGDSVTDIITKLRDMYMDYACGYNVDGEFEFKKIVIQKEDEVAEPKWRFDSTANDRADLTLDFRETYSLKDIRNRVIVYGRGSEKTGIQPQAEVRVTDPKSPFNVYAIGERTKIFSEDKFVNDDQCAAKGRYEVLKLSTFQETADITTVPIYSLNTDDIIEVVHPETKENLRYIVNDFDFGLDVGSTMSISATKLYYSRLEYGEEKKPLVDAIIRGISNWGWLSLGEERVKACYGLSGSGQATLIVRFHEGVYGGDQASITSYGTTKNQTMLIDLTDFEDLDFNDENGAVTGRSKGDYLDRVLGHEMFHAVTNDYLGHDTMIQLPVWFKEGFAEFLHGAKERYESTYQAMSKEKRRKELTERAKRNLKGEWEGLSEDYVSSYLIAIAIYRLCTPKQWDTLFSDLKDIKNPSINFLLKLLPIAETNDLVIDKVVAEIESMTDVWDKLEDKHEIDTMSVGGKHFMNLFGVSLTAESVFNNADARTDSIGFQLNFIK
ncbi:flagellin [Vagococcus fluvialis]|uniref:flagellin n=1 Tax=Vagococcus fluvialis TaxID=2738 RepID=UPI001D0AEC31|nr:flagellin [Vagococcus fluvialis]UDM72725.1 flagellin [Vagococcus fluvialis]UDM78447.1 flagellin [Vagococcus fluvialis]UDM84000.1 flagellin [Vagococcus fluvialis]